jgi:putative SOS response-associated peptidase YedK
VGQRRILIPASGFYEWKKEGSSKQPYYITRKDGRPFAFAGLWEHWDQGGESLQSCAIVTTEPNELLVPIHNRMPVIIPVEQYDTWLSPESNPGELKYLLAPLPPEELTLYPVAPLVNNPANDSPDLLINGNITTESTEK